jgi:hypothetical protein
MNDGRPGLGARIAIWTLAVLLYGGGLSLWFAAMPVVRPAVQAALSILYMFKSPAMAEGEPVDLSGAMIGIEEPESAGAVAPEEAPPSEEPPAKKSFWGSLSDGDSSTEKWPSLKVDGVMTQRGAEGVLLDKNIVPPGSMYRGLKVVRVEPGRALLEFNGRQRWVLVGDLTDAENP